MTEGRPPIAFSEEDTHAFIVRIWREPREIEEVSPVWRGMIEHAFTGERRYIDDLCGIGTFLSAHLSEMGVKVGLCCRLAHWLHAWKQALTRQGKGEANRP